MVRQSFRWILMVLGAVLLLAVAVPWVPLFQVPEPYATDWVSAKLLMLPAGAMCLGAAALLAVRTRRR